MKKSELAYNGVMNEMIDFYKRHINIDNGEILQLVDYQKCKGNKFNRKFLSLNIHDDVDMIWKVRTTYFNKQNKRNFKFHRKINYLF